MWPQSRIRMVSMPPNRSVRRSKRRWRTQPCAARVSRRSTMPAAPSGAGVAGVIPGLAVLAFSERKDAGKMRDIDNGP